MLNALRRHYPEYLMEAAGLGLFMLSACLFGALLEHPASPLRQALGHAFARRTLMGAFMGLTAVAIIYSPWGQQSGAHLNPSVTLTFLRLGKLPLGDAVFYVLAQFAGGLLGVLLSRAIVGSALGHPAVHYVVTAPGPGGRAVAFAGEALISFGLMLTVLIVSNSSRARLTGLLAGVLVAAYIAFEAPLSGMSMNPARTFASALPSGDWSAAWIYFVAPPLGMLAAAEAYRARRGAGRCAKLQHDNARRCIFCGKPAGRPVAAA